MKVTLDTGREESQEYDVREEMPGIIQFTRSKDGSLYNVETIECSLQNVERKFGLSVYVAVDAYLRSAAHLEQLLIDYGWSQSAPHPITFHEPGVIYTKLTIRKREYIRVTGQKKNEEVAWYHYENELSTVKTWSDNAAMLWKFLNTPSAG